MHWAEKYIGQKWTPLHDCFYWFRAIQNEEFHRKIADIQVPHNNKTLFAARWLTDSSMQYFCWQKTNTPKEGDAALMAIRSLPVHIGTVAIINNVPHIVHALKEDNLIISSNLYLYCKNLHIVDYWTPTHENC